MTRFRAFSILCILAATSAPALAQSPATRARLAAPIDAPVLSDHFPVVALATGLSGRAIVECEISREGDAACAIAEESPTGMGFGIAAERLVESASFNPATENGVAIASTARIPVNFENPESARGIVASDLIVSAIRNASGEQQAGERRFYPITAHQQGITGRALIACVQRSDGRRECGVEREEPIGWSFGDAALDIINHNTRFHAAQNAPAGAAVRIPVEFVIRESASTDPARPNRWEREPSPEEIAAAYPSGALMDGVAGRVALICAYRPDRRINCEIGSEEPRDQGFSTAALQISQHYELAADQLGRPGISVGDRTIIILNFRVAR